MPTYNGNTIITDILYESGTIVVRPGFKIPYDPITVKDIAIGDLRRKSRVKDLSTYNNLPTNNIDCLACKDIQISTLTKKVRIKNETAYNSLGDPINHAVTCKDIIISDIRKKVVIVQP